MNPTHLVGAFDVTFVSTAGPRSGKGAAGTLSLRAQEPALVNLAQGDSSVTVTQPVVGLLELPLDSIGAVRMGDPMSEDASSPGIAIYITRTRAGEVADILARVGSGSNARGQLPSFDAGFFTLFVRRLGPDGIWGDWRSSPGAGGGLDRETVGHFCAIKQR